MQVNYRNQKLAEKQHYPRTKSDQLGKRVLFPQSAKGEKKSKADLMLALNKVLQKKKKSHMYVFVM